MKKIHLDFETRSEVNLKTAGAWKYAQSPTTEILCLSYSVDGGPVYTLKRPFFNTPTPNPRPPEIQKFIDDKDYVWVAHSAHFEYAIWEYVLKERYGWASLSSPERWRCTLAKAAAANLPHSLDKVGAAIGLQARKFAIQGKMVLGKVSVPQGIDPLGDAIWNNDPALFEQLYAYNAQDVRAEIELDNRVPDLPPCEQKIWELDLVINKRGVLADVQGAEKAAAMAESITDRLNLQLQKLTEGQVNKASQVQEIRHWLERTEGVKEPTMDKAVLLRLLSPTNPKPLSLRAREVLYIRSQVGKSSTAKYKKVVGSASDRDGRVRGALQYHGAGTGRWAGRIIQPQNIPPSTEENTDRAISAIKAGDAEWFEVCYPRPMETLSSCLRGIMITAGKGKKLICADYSGIEVRVLMWLAGAKEALEMLRSGKGLYIPMAEYIYKKAPGEITKDGTPVQYKVGKETILGAGYGMYWVKFQAQCRKKGIELGTPELTGEVTDDENRKGKKRFMTDAEVRARDAILGYRSKYHMVPQLWKDMENAAKLAIKNPGLVYTIPAGSLKWGLDKKREFLCCLLPSGRCLRYFRPSIKGIVTAWGQDREEIVYWAEDTQGIWSEQKTYGGSLVENVTQALAREIMANGMLQCEAAGYPIVMTVHDEIIAEVCEPRDKDVALADFIRLMCTLPSWAAGMPVAAEGWVGDRYKK